MKTKQFLCLILVVLLLIPVPTKATDNPITSLVSHNANVLFSNGYRGFCLDRQMKGATVGDVFVPMDTSAALSNADSSCIAHRLKILFTHCFEDIFVSDGNGGYVMDSLTADSVVQGVIYYYTESYQYIYGKQKTLAEKVAAYTGPAIPDCGYQKTLANGDVITFYFLVMRPENTAVQDFFAYCISVTPAGSHTHSYGEEWKTDGEQHWHECECGEISGAENHSGGEADCVTAAVCEVCGASYGEADKANHTGETELRNAAEATEAAPGYTGDIHCKDCGELLEAGEVIPQLPADDPEEKLPTDDPEEKLPEADEKIPQLPMLSPGGKLPGAGNVILQQPVFSPGGKLPSAGDEILQLPARSPGGKLPEAEEKLPQLPAPEPEDKQPEENEEIPQLPAPEPEDKQPEENEEIPQLSAPEPEDKQPVENEEIPQLPALEPEAEQPEENEEIVQLSAPEPEDKQPVENEEIVQLSAPEPEDKQPEENEEIPQLSVPETEAEQPEEALISPGSASTSAGVPAEVNSDIPQTGDDASVILWVSLMVLSGALMGVCAMRKSDSKKRTVKTGK